MTDVAVVGVGDWGKNLLRVFDSEATVRSCCHTGDSDNARWLADNYPDVAVTTDYDEVLDSDVDAVVVATPIGTHVPLVRAALAADKHVFVEKPLGTDREAAADLAAIARERGRRLFVGYLFVHHPLFARVVEIAATEGVRSLGLEWNYVGGFGAPLLPEYACHPVSVATALFDDRTEGVTVDRSGRDGRSASGPAVDVSTCEGVTGGLDTLGCTLTYSDVTCDLRVDRLSPRAENTRITLVTASDDCYVWDDTTLRRFDPDGGAFRTAATADEEPLAAECRAFLANLGTDTSLGDEAVVGTAEGVPRTDGEFAATVHEVLDEIRSQCETTF